MGDNVINITAILVPINQSFNFIFLPFLLTIGKKNSLSGKLINDDYIIKNKDFKEKIRNI